MALTTDTSPTSAATGCADNPYHDYIRLHELNPIWECRSNWVGEVVFRCGFAAVELCLGLLEVLAGDDRAHVAVRDRNTQLIDGIVAQLDLVARGIRLDLGGLRQAPTVPHPAAHTRLHDRFDTLDERSRLRLRTGIDRVLAELPPDCGLDESATVALPYDNWIGARDLWQRAAAKPYCFEDLPFRTVHQSMECWFRLLHGVLHWCEDRVRQRDWAAAAAGTSFVAEVLYYLGTHVRLLDHMDLGNYHPLRVALKSASGAQSVGALAMFGEVRRQYAHYEAAREPGRTVAQLFERPSDHIDEYRYVDALGRLESAFADFLHSHYYRAIRVQSRSGLGSLGAGIDGLLARALRPVFPALDEARFEHLLFNNWQFAPVQGVLLEVQADVRPEDVVAAQLDDIGRIKALAAAERLAKAFEDNDFAACAECFDAAGALWELRDSRPYPGSHEVSGYFESVFQSLRIEAVRVAQSGWMNERLVRSLVVGFITVTGKAATLPATWELTFTDAADISSLIVEWDTSAIARLMIDSGQIDVRPA